MGSFAMEEAMEGKHPWQARLGVGVTMLLLAFFGVVVTDVASGDSFDFWKWVAPIYAILSLWLSWYTRKASKIDRLALLGHEALHWVGLILAVLLISWFVHLGNLSRFNAGLVNLTLLALTVFLAGVYTEKTFLLIGMILGIFAFFSAFIVQYLWAILIPVLIGGIAVITLIVWLGHKKSKSQ